MDLLDLLLKVPQIKAHLNRVNPVQWPDLIVQTMLKGIANSQQEPPPSSNKPPPLQYSVYPDWWPQERSRQASASRAPEAETRARPAEDARNSSIPPRPSYAGWVGEFKFKSAGRPKKRQKAQVFEDLAERFHRKSTPVRPFPQLPASVPLTLQAVELPLSP